MVNIQIKNNSPKLKFTSDDPLNSRNHPIVKKGYFQSKREFRK